MLAHGLGNDRQIDAFVILNVKTPGSLVDQFFFCVAGHVCQGGIHIDHETLAVGDQNGFGCSLEHPGENGLFLRGKPLLFEHALQGIRNFGNFIASRVYVGSITPTLNGVRGQLHEIVKPSSRFFRKNPGPAFESKKQQAATGQRSRQSRHHKQKG